MAFIHVMTLSIAPFSSCHTPTGISRKKRYSSSMSAANSGLDIFLFHVPFFFFQKARKKNNIPNHHPEVFPVPTKPPPHRSYHHLWHIPFRFGSFMALLHQELPYNSHQPERDPHPPRTRFHFQTCFVHRGKHGTYVFGSPFRYEVDRGDLIRFL